MPAAHEAAQKTAKVERPPANRTLVNTTETLQALVERVREAGTYAIDVETTSTEPMTAELVGIAIAVSPTESFYIPVGHDNGVQLSLDKVRRALGPILSDPKIRAIAHHGKYDELVLLQHDFPLNQIAD